MLSRIIAFVFLSSLFFSCKQRPAESKSKKSATSVDSTSVINITPFDTVLHQYSCYIAGLTVSSSAKISPVLLQNDFYKKYVLALDSNFQKIEASRLNKMRAWAKTEMSAELNTPKVLFYPFSGPDALHAFTFYPNAQEYIMVAMERCGNLPDFSKMDSAKAAYYLNSVNQSLEDIFDKSYFITRKMVGDLQKEKVNGVAPLICLFLERTGHPVSAINKKHLNDDGTIVDLAADSLPNHLNDFIEICFRDTATNATRKIKYFRANLGNQKFGGLPALSENKPLQNYFNSLPDFYCYTKSASYLMNYENFSTIRNLCLAKSISVLQDDTGIGFGYFDATKWKVKLYGRYVKPVKDFKWVFDTKLAAAYTTDSANVNPLAFSLGYHWGNKNEQNLMKAERR